MDCFKIYEKQVIIEGWYDLVEDMKWGVVNGYLMSDFVTDF